MNEWIDRALVAAGVLVTLLAFLVPYMAEQRRRQAKAIADAIAAAEENQTKAINEVKRQNERAVDELRTAQLHERADRVEKTSRLHERIDDMQETMIKSQEQRLSRMEGLLEGQGSLLKSIHGWLLKRAEGD